MNSILKLATASALMLGAAMGVAKAQQATEAPLPPAGAEQVEDGAGDEYAEWGHKGRRHGGHHGEGQGNGMGEGRGRHGGGHRMLIDVNADGAISEDEAAVLADHAFNRMDQNGDASLTEAEYTAAPGGRGHHRGWFNWGNSDEAAAVMKVRKDKFVVLDADKNAALSKAEFFADAKAKLAGADADKDGKVSPWEFRAQN